MLGVNTFGSASENTQVTRGVQNATMSADINY